MSSSMDCLPGASCPVLTTDMLGRLYDLNLDYLDLVIAERAGQRDSAIRYLPQRAAEALAACAVEHRQAIAAASFSLYSLGFEDVYFWRSVLRTSQEPIDARYRTPSCNVARSAFCEIALLHAWHVAITRPIAARVLYGMPAPIVEGMARAHLWQFKRIAADYPDLLMPRWPSNPCFWPDMIEFARRGDSRRLALVHQLGHQLIALELQASAARRSALRRRNLSMQRMR